LPVPSIGNVAMTYVPNRSVGTSSKVTLPDGEVSRFTWCVMVTASPATV